ncbi:MAG: hypothetical protein U1C46_09310, partial [Bacteroidales bacterium]|nr:hypothetical protein [Bacteroidales bacterium]
WMGSVFNSPALGFLSVAGLYLLFFLISYIFRGKLFIGYVIRHLAKIFFAETNHKEEEDED